MARAKIYHPTFSFANRMWVLEERMDFRAAYLEEVRRGMRGYKRLAESAIAQVDDAALHAKIDPEANSIAVLMQHIGGNLRSRFTDFLTSDGEKPDRFRETEFAEDAARSRAQLMEIWEKGWQCVLGTLESLRPEDVERSITIRTEPHTVVQALNRATMHMAQHIGQIVLLAKHLKGAEWQTLSIPKGRSEEFKTVHNRNMGMPRA
jgi:uncharacterized protein DUF1572